MEMGNKKAYPMRTKHSYHPLCYQGRKRTDTPMKNDEPISKKNQVEGNVLLEDIIRDGARK